MKTLEYTYVDKSTWTDGPWKDEIDKRQWSDEETGLPCLIVRNSMGALCGYVGVQPGHPVYEQRYTSVQDVQVHGGLTFSGRSNCCERSIVVEPGESDDVWWLGFDCSHLGDITPMRLSCYSDEHYRDIDYVARECRSMAKQLAAMASGWRIGN